MERNSNNSLVLLPVERLKKVLQPTIQEGNSLATFFCSYVNYYHGYFTWVFSEPPSMHTSSHKVCVLYAERIWPNQIWLEVHKHIQVNIPLSFMSGQKPKDRGLPLHLVCEMKAGGWSMTLSLCTLAASRPGRNLTVTGRRHRPDRGCVREMLSHGNNGTLCPRHHLV